MDSPQGFSIRPVSEHDAEEIARLDQQLGGPWRIEHWEERIAFAARRDPEGSLVATADGELIGYLFTEVRTQQYGFPDSTGWLEAFAVRPDHQRKGVAAQLMERVLDRFRYHKIEQVRTLVSDSHAALEAFFASHGFAIEPIKVMRLTPAVRSLQ